MANEHYKQGAVETRTLISEVFKHIPWLSPDDAADVYCIIKYAQRAGLKEGASWEQDAYKIADFITHLIFGKFIDQIEEFAREGGVSYDR